MPYSREYRLRIIIYPEAGGNAESRQKEWRIPAERVELVAGDLAPLGVKIIKALEELEEASQAATDL